MADEHEAHPEPPVDPLIGRLVAGKYKVHELIARGGMGRIYKAEQIPIGRPVALKVLNPRYQEVEPNFEKRFLQEAATCGRLRHPNTVVLYDYGKADEDGHPMLFMAMEFIDGPTLSRVMKREGPLSEDRAVAIARGIGRSLREAHKIGIVHRDLKPSNVMLVQGEDGEAVKVVDFGVAKLVHADTEALTMHDNIVGSPRYMAPEQIRHLDVDGRTDIYALGVLLFEMLAGSVPFEGERAIDTLVLHLTGTFPSIRDRSGRHVDPELEEIVKKCTAKAQNDRFADIEELLQRLRRWARVHGELDATDEHRRDPNSGSGPRRIDSHPPDGSGTIDAAVPAEALARGRSTRWLAPLIAGVAILLLLVVVLVPRWVAQPAPEPAPIVAPPPEAPAPLPPPVAPHEVTLHLSSTPTGAQVWEGNRLLGVTELAIPLTADAAERTFTLKLAGYDDATVTQAGSDEDLTRTVPLSKTPTRPGPHPTPRPAPRPVDDLKRNR